MVPLFRRTQGRQGVLPSRELTLDELAEVLRTNEELRVWTDQVRTAPNDEATNEAKLNLPIVVLGGPFKSCGAPHDSMQGRQYWQCNDRGYRDMAHIDWARRTGIVSLDVDELYSAAPTARQELIRHAYVRIAWVSASGNGLKVGVQVYPTPSDTTGRDHHDAWAAAVERVSVALCDYPHKIDPTKDATRISILAHDPHAFVRPAKGHIIWEPGQHDQLPTHLAMPLFVSDAPVNSIEDLAGRYNWGEGTRSRSLHHFALTATYGGYDRNTILGHGMYIAYATGAVAKYGAKACERHLVRGCDQAQSKLLYQVTSL